MLRLNIIDTGIILTNFSIFLFLKFLRRVIFDGLVATSKRRERLRLGTSDACAVSWHRNLSYGTIEIFAVEKFDLRSKIDNAEKRPS